jgi:CRP-like cAMP-binding protein
MERLRTVVRCEVNETVYHCEDPARYWYRLLKGTARKCALTVDGRRQIIDFLLPGDLFGFGAEDTHHFSAEAITPGTVIARYPRLLAAQLAEAQPDAGRWVRELAFASISRLQSRMLILGRTGAQARVSAFLVEWIGRNAGQEAQWVSLPMSRYDIADYLAMAVETVSRTFTALRVSRVIAVRGTRRITICDRRALELASEGLEADLMPPRTAPPEGLRR